MLVDNNTHTHDIALSFVLVELVKTLLPLHSGSLLWQVVMCALSHCHCLLSFYYCHNQCLCTGAVLPKYNS